jgi:hypothetical protein
LKLFTLPLRLSETLLKIPLKEEEPYQPFVSASGPIFRMAGATGLRYNFTKPTANESPLFERQMSDEYAELQHCRMIIEQQQQRIHRLENINIDLERRLEDQARQSMDVEAECIAIERRWKERGEEYEQEIDRMRKELELEKRRSALLREHLSRAEREIYTILQRSYGLRRGPPTAGGTNIPPPPGTDNLINSKLSASSDGIHIQGTMKRVDTSASDLDLYQVARPSEPKKIREKKILVNLADFLGF